MIEANLESYRQALETKLSELVTSSRNIDGIAIERLADWMDEVILANERHLALCALTRETLLYQQVSEAIERLRAGTFGLCLQCDDPISERRLQALPWAALRLRCQEVADNAQGAEKNDLKWPFSAAA